MKVNALSTQTYNSTTFEGKNYPFLCSSYILKRAGEITPDKYEQMSFIKKFLLRKFTPERMVELAKTTCDTAYKLKSKLDKRFGENNYVIIAVGRSIASIAETINFMGGDAKIIPLSELRHTLPKQISDIDIYKKFLESIGLTKEIIRENPDKRFILMDYAVSGDSLQTAKEFLEKPDLLGKSDNFTDREINTLNSSLTVCNLLYHARFKPFSPVGKLPLENLSKVFIQADSATSKEGKHNICQYMRKLFLFNILDSLKKENFHNFIPQKELAAVKRYESQTFLSQQMEKTLNAMREAIQSLNVDN